MRAITMIICCLFLQLGMVAQKDITVLHVSGQAFYYEQTGAKAISMYPGMELALKGRMRCKGASTAKLLYNGVSIMVSGGKLRDLKEVVKSAGVASQMSFTGRFFSFVTESVREGNTQEDIKKYHRKYMGKTSGGIKGYAKPDYTIRPLLLTAGKLPSANVIFKWRNTAGEGHYTFSLLTKLGKPVAQILTRDTAITLDLDQLALDLDEEYSWNVSRGETAKSVNIPFEICPTSVVERLTDLSHEPAFVEAEPEMKQMMLAYRLEEERCFYSAYQTYTQLIGAEPDNLLLRRMYAAFLARMDMLPEASSLLFSSNN
ncbi:MAG: hypothetical protein Q7T20_00590 [Saprospiraceae bacterium]|nr:hypothetical protein [Saprospiraceae bacterium]